MTVAVVGDGAVGLCAMIAAKRLGAGRVIALSRNPARQALARDFGATDIVAERGDGAAEAVMAITDGLSRPLRPVRWGGTARSPARW
jgi:threonine dehydrogenase-like Zn-dependent dehydrogenase